MALRARVLGTFGVSSIENYSSSVNPATRRLTVDMTITTIYGGQQQVAVSVPISPSFSPAAFIPTVLTGV
jgi:hypothetical protein